MRSFPCLQLCRRLGQLQEKRLTVDQALEHLGQYDIHRFFIVFSSFCLLSPTYSLQSVSRVGSSWATDRIISKVGGVRRLGGRLLGRRAAFGQGATGEEPNLEPLGA